MPQTSFSTFLTYWKFIRTMSAAACVLCAPCSLAAQRDESPRTTVFPAVTVGSIIDTTIRPGRQDLTTYTTPSACLAAAMGIQQVTQRAAIDTGLYAPLRDTVPSAAVAMARTCGARMNAQTVPPDELMPLMRLALIAGDDAKARAAADRRVALLRTPSQQAQALLEIDTTYLQAQPMRLAVAETVLTRLDALGQVAALQRSKAHHILYTYADGSFDVPLAEREAAAVWALDPQIGEYGRGDNDALSIRTEALGVYSMYLVTMSPDSALKRIMQLLKAGGPGYPERWLADVQKFPTIIQSIARIGQPVPPFTAKYWFGPAEEHRWPVPGKVSVFMGNGETEWHGKDATVRRLKQKYGDRLNITYVMKTQGYFHDSPPLTPDQEAERFRKYIQDELKLPVTLAVEETPFEQLPDGRRIQGEAPSSRSDFYKHGFLLVDPAGKLVMPLNWGSEAMFDALIAHALGQQVPGRK